MRWRRITGIGTLLIIAGTATVYMVLASYDYNKLKSHLARMVQEVTGRKLQINGDIALALRLSPTLVAEDVVLANAPWGSKPEMINIEKLQLQVRLWPLLLRDLEVRQIGLAGIKVLVETGPDAQPNWDFRAAKTPAGLGALAPVEIAVDHLHIADLELIFFRHQTQSKTQLNIAHLDLSRRGAEDKLTLNLRGDYNGQAVTLDGTIGSHHALFKRERFPVQLQAKSLTVTAAIKGAIDNIHALTGFDLHLDGSGQDLSEIGPFIGKALPMTDQFALKGRLTGTAQALALQDAQGSARRDNLHFTVNGTIQKFFSFEGMDLQSQLTGESLTAFGDIIDVKLPSTDQFEIQGRLTGTTAKLALQAAMADAERGDMHLSLAGAVKNLRTLEGMDLKTHLVGKNLTAFGDIIDVKLPATDQFEVQGRLTGTTEKLALQAAKANAEWGGMRLSLAGAVKNLRTLEGMDLQSRLAGKELAEIGPLVGTALPDLGAFDVQGKLTGSPEALSLEPLTATIAKSDFQGQASLVFRQRPQFTLRLDSSLIDFTALTKSMEKDAPPPITADTPHQRLFSDAPLSWEVFPKVDADIVLNARQIHARNARFESCHLALKREARAFSINKLEALYKGAKIAGNLHIEQGELPQVTAEFLVQNFNLGEFLKETGKRDDIRAVIDIAAHGQSEGDSIKRLMANLDGAIGAVMGEGYLTRYLDMLSAGLSEKVIQFWDPPEDVDQVKCAVVQFDINKGVAASRAFVFNTRAGIIFGQGEIDLGAEKIDFLLVPKSRHPELGIKPKLKVKGTVMEPKVSVAKLSLLTSGAEGLSEFVVGPVGLLAPFAHMGAGKAHPCDVKGIEPNRRDIPAEEQAPSP